MRLFKKIFDRFATAEDAAAQPHEHALLVRFRYGRSDLAALDALEGHMRRALAGTGAGEVDGHDLATDGGDATLYLHGRDANELFDRIRPTLLECAWLDEARVTLRYGPPEDGIASHEGVVRPLKFPFPVETMPGDRALARWRALRAEAGCTPVILGGLEDRMRLWDMRELHAMPLEAILARADEIDAAAWLHEQAEADRLAELSDGTWPTDARTRSTLSVPFSGVGGSEGPRPDVGVACLPTARHWEAAAWLAFGGWDVCPQPAEHVALWRSWAERYGAQVACVTGSVVEFVVDRPPRTREAALALAREHFAYCEDCIVQGAGTLEALAAQRLDATVWTFWWD